MKETILVPVDFSENARQAAHYAASLASRKLSDVYLLHVFPRFYSPLVGEDIHQKSQVQYTELLQPKLDALKQELRKAFPELHIDGTCVPGHLTNEVSKLLASGNYKLVVMGTKGITDNDTVLIGSNTYELITKATVPVLAVPANGKMFEAERIGMLTNFKEEEQKGLQWFRQLVGAFDLILLHVAEKDNEQIEAKMADWKARIGKEIEPDRTKDLIGHGEDLPKVINDLIATHQIDLLIVNNTKKSFFEALFSRSLVKSIAHRLTVPVFFYSSEV